MSRRSLPAKLKQNNANVNVTAQQKLEQNLRQVNEDSDITSDSDDESEEEGNFLNALKKSREKRALRLGPHRRPRQGSQRGKTVQKKLTLQRARCLNLLAVTNLRGCYPLDPALWKKSMNKVVQRIDLSGDQYATDAVLHVLLQNKAKLADVCEIDLHGSIHITDRGLKWLAQLLEACPEVSLVNLNACLNITEKGLQYLQETKKSLEITASATNTSFLSAISKTDGSKNFQGCPLLLGKLDKYQSRPYGKVVIVSDSAQEDSLLEYLTDKAIVANNGGFGFRAEWDLQETELSLVQLSLRHPCCELLLTPEETTQVILPLNIKGSLNDAKTFLASTVSYFVTKEVKRKRQSGGLGTQCGKWSKGALLGGHFNYAEGSFSTTASFFDPLSYVAMPQFTTKQHFTRMNRYLELELTGLPPGEESGEIYPAVFSYPLYRNSSMETFFETFNMKVGDYIGIGVRYHDENSPEYYTCLNGTDEAVLKVDKRVLWSMCPGVSCARPGTTMKIRNYWSPPEEWLERNEKENSLVENCPLLNKGMIIDDRTGIISYAPENSQVTVFQCSDALKEGTYEFALKILNTGNKGCITIGIGHEGYETDAQPGWREGSIGYHADDGLLYIDGQGISPQSPCKCTEGDIMKVKVCISLTPNSTQEVTFYKNDQQVATVPWLYDYDTGQPMGLVPIFGMHSPGEQLQILNYRVPYDFPDMDPNFAPSENNFLLQGESFDMSLDGGILTGIDSSESGYTFKSANTLNRKHHFFEVTVEEVHNRMAGIGLCVESYSCTGMPGWLKGSIGFHFDNNGLYREWTSVQRKAPGDLVNKGDIIRCGFDIAEAKFDSDGYLEPNQSLNIYFTNCGNSLLSEEFYYRGGGLHACIGMSEVGMKLRLENFLETSSASSDDGSEGTKFLVVTSDGSAESSDNYAAKTTEIATELCSELQTCAEEMKKAAKLLSSDKTNLQFSTHRQYAQLVSASENLNHFVENVEKRLKFLPLDTGTGQGHQAILDHIAQTQKNQMSQHPYLYNLSSQVTEVIDRVLGMKDKKLASVDEVRQCCKDLELAENLGVYTRILKLMSFWGKVIYFDCSDPGIVVTDPAWFLQTIQDIEQKATENAAADVRCLAPDTQLWADRTLFKNGLKTVDKDKMRLLLEVLLSSNQLMRLPAHRTQPADVKFHLLHPQRLREPPTQLEKFLRPSIESNMQRVKRVYTFPAGFAGHVFTALLATCVKFCRPLLLWKQGMVFHQGAAEAVLILEDDKSHPTLEFEVKGFLPDGASDRQHPSTESLQRHLWAVFHIYADIIEFVLHRTGVVVLMETTPTTKQANVSICSTHIWETPFNPRAMTDCETNEAPITVCTLCNNCCESGMSCDYNGILGDEYRQCLCRTPHVCCWDCGLCKHCAKALWDIRTFLRPSCELVPQPNSLSWQAQYVAPEIPLDTTIINSVTLACNGTEKELDKMNFSLLSKDKEVLIHVFPFLPMLCLRDNNYLMVSRQSLRKTGTSDSHKLSPGDTVQLALKEPKVRWTQEGGPPWVPETQKKDIKYHFHIRENMYIWQARGLVRFAEAGRVRIGRLPVGLIAAAQPINSTHPYFEIEIKNRGQYCRTGVGLVPRNYAKDMMPGWGSRSIGYHADDGGFFVEQGSSKLPKGPKCKEGDKLGCGVDFSKLVQDKYVVYFTKNGEKVFELPFLSKDQELFPSVGMHSRGEVVQLLSEDVWGVSEDAQLQSDPSAEEKWFEDDLMRIRPSKVLRLKKKDLDVESRNTSVFLSKPLPSKFNTPQLNQSKYVNLPDRLGENSKESGEIHLWPKEPPTGMWYLYKVMVTNPNSFVARPNKGIIKDNLPLTISVVTKDATDDDIVRSKFQVKYAQVPTFDEDQTTWESQWDSLPKEAVHALKLNVAPADPEKSKTSVSPEEHDPDFLPDVGSIDPPAAPTYVLEVKKNGLVVSSVYIPRLSYQVIVENADADAYNNLAISLPRFPTYCHSSVFEPGMQVQAELTSKQIDLNDLIKDVSKEKRDQYFSSEERNAEMTFGVLCTVEEVLPGNKLALSWDADPDSGVFTFDLDSDLLHPVDWSPKSLVQIKVAEDEVDMKLHLDIENASGNDKTLLTVSGKVVNPAPYHLFSKKQGRPDGSGHELPLSTPCNRHQELFTVQEAALASLAPVLKSWESDSLDGYNLSKIQVFLPKVLDRETLTYPSLNQLLDCASLAVHQLCKLHYSPLEIKHEVEKPLYNLLHFIDAEGRKQDASSAARDRMMEIVTAWAYSELLISGVKLPSFSRLAQGVEDRLSRSQVESYLQYIVRIYASSIGALAQKYGGVTRLPGVDNGPQDDNVVHYYGIRAPYSKSGPLTQKEGNNQSGSTTQNGKAVETFRKSNGLMDGVCFAHFYTEVNREGDPARLTLNDIGPYAELVSKLMWNTAGLKSLPAGIPEKFNGLEAMVLTKTDSLQKLPSDMSSMNKLRIVSVEKSNLAEIPADIGDCPSLEDLIISKSKIESFPASITRCLPLKRLTGQNMMLRSLPDDFPRLKNLTVLDLNLNPLLKLPEGFGSLRALKTLKLSAVPWMPGSTAGSDLDLYMGWHQTSSSIMNLIGKEETKTLFHKCDKDGNGLLDQTELADLNAHLYYKMARLGHDFEEWDKDGGVPMDIFELENLERLDLQYQNLRFIPAEINKLGYLHTLNLNHCMLLESLPSTMGELPSLNTIHLRGCPSLRTPPNEVVSRGTESVMAYLKRLSGGFTENWRTKLMLVGLGGAGKTSLLQALMSSRHKTNTLTTKDITDGIEIKSWTRVHKESGHKITYSTWDFAGQTVYYNTHQFFLSNRAIYLLLWTTRLGFEHAGLEFWLSSIRCHAPKAPIFIIGTHCDQVPKAELPQAKLLKQYPQIRGFHFVSSISGQGIANLEKAILDATVEEQYMGEKIPQVYLNLEKKILQTREETSVLPWDRIENFGMEVGIYDERDIRRAVQFLHDLGTVQYFDNEFLRDNIVINPQWIVDVMACVVSVKDSSIENGKFQHEDIKKVWKDYPEELHEWLLRLTEAFDLTFPLPNQPANIVPCLLPPAEPEYDWPALERGSEMSETLMVYKFAYLPAGLFNRTQVRLFQFSDSEVLWKTGSLLRKNRHLALVTQQGDSCLQVKVQGPRPQNILFLIHEVIESLIMESFSGVTYDFTVPCPDCLVKFTTDGASDPYMFKASLVREAHNRNAPFLQCRKYFHVVSMPLLQASMPTDSSEDFDAVLAKSMHALQDLRSMLSRDVFMSYCQADVPSGGDLEKYIHPKMVKQDLKKAGLKCWCKNNMKDIPLNEKILALQDSKVMVVFMSSDYEKDEHSRSLFFHAINTSKPITVVAVGKNLDWTKTDLGLMIGDEVFANMKTKSRYSEELPKLVKFIKGKISETEQAYNSSRHPECFLSYCWSNSESASKGKGRANPKALGWGDPREIKKQLEKQGINCWLDIEQTGKNGLYADICAGIKEAHVLVACVSPEYADSKNCMMELRFAACTMNKPIIFAVVGTGDTWQWGEIGMLEERSKAPKVNFQFENPDGYDQLGHLIKERLQRNSDRSLGTAEQDTSRPSSVASVNEISFQEEYELAQRRFLRHIAILAEGMDTVHFPRLFVLDFHQVEPQTAKHLHAQGIGSQSSRPKSSRNRPPSGTRREASNLDMKPQRRSLQRRETSSHLMDPVDLEDEWLEQEFCVKMLCEHDQGWHTTDHVMPFSLGPGRQKQEFIQKIGPFLARLYALLKHSGAQLDCMDSEMGCAFQEYLENRTQEGSVDFVKSYRAFRFTLVDREDEMGGFGGLSRCHLPTGQIRWLCSEHQKANRVTVLSSVSYTPNRQPLVTEEDFIMKDFLEKYEEMRDPYRTRKGQRPPSPCLDAESEFDKVESSTEEDGKTDAKPEVDTSNTEPTSKDEKNQSTEPKDAKNKEEEEEEGQELQEPLENKDQSPSEAKQNVESARSKSAEERKQAMEKIPGASAKLKVAGQVAQASTSWPGQPTSRACAIL